ncbi:MAG TPA: hypothetical protein VHS03_09445 [Gaiellaceae bacterium]|nr:hypothetical protein [Gaiellaceae bacterium]
MHLTLLSPAGLLLALGAIPVLAAFAVGERRSRRVGAVLRLRSPGRRGVVAAVIAICVLAGLLGVAAARPVVDEAHARYLRTDAEAIVALDVSRSMLAASTPTSPTRLARARQVAVALRAAIPDVPTGVASFTDRVLPNLLPTSDIAVFDATVERSVGIDRPPPGGNALTVTTFDALAAPSKDGYFAPGRKRRVLVILTDGESVDFDVGPLRSALRDAPGLHTVLVRIGSSHEHVYGADGLPEADYRPTDTSEEIKRFVAATGAQAFGAGDLSGAEAAVRRDAGAGPRVRAGSESSSTDVAPYLVLAAFLPLGLLIRLRNVL